LGVARYVCKHTQPYPDVPGCTVAISGRVSGLYPYQVLSLVPSETEGEPFEEGLARVRRCIGGGGGCLGNANESDNDLEVVADFITVNLRCPMSGLRMNVAGRFKYCEHMGCFDLQTFIELNKRTRKWQCPICLKNYSLENIVIDQYFSRIASVMKGYPEDVSEVEVKPDGSWRPKQEGEAKYREKWYLADGSFHILNEDTKSKPKTSNLVKQEDHLAEACMTLKIGMKRNHDGVWELNGAKDNVISSNSFNKNKKQKSKKFLQCNSPTANNRNHEDPRVNQEASENLDILVDNDPDFASASLGLVLPLSPVVKNVSSELQKECEVIVLSDSEEEFEDELKIGSSAASAFAGSDNPAQGGCDRRNSSENLPEEALISCNSIPFVTSSSPVLNTVPFSVNCPLDLFGVDAFEFDPPNWSPKSQNGPFQLFGMDTSAPEPTANSQHISVVRSTSVTGYNVALQEQIRKSSVSRIPDYARSPDSGQNYSNTEVSGTPAENLSSTDNGDASLQLFLSPQPDPTSVQDDPSEPIVCSDTFQTNWISLTLGNENITGTHTQETLITKRQQTADQRRGLDSLEITALNVNSNGNLLGSFDYRGSESPLRHQQPQSVGSRLCLPVDSDSD
ncbi:hypothetical protein KI387_005897, partial [Taxus chinensis]